jgi:hypothetical protein
MTLCIAIYANFKVLKREEGIINPILQRGVINKSGYL